ncbi:type I methionyl aminopeptidase [Halosquirtibacter laminarini]|uniref:Type I methionyl aminopeptidase n=1 Tax=Halosquirtibacter laminarini TaxID=3374600 RepID=A0AC61NLZ0_9BACT|nr:type I methionyl aminopeptidase [Prolixibacteraceae bacterium]
MSIVIKTPEQIEGIRKSSKLAGQVLQYIEPFVKEGVHTEYLDDLIRKFMEDHGAIPATLGYNGYPKSSCISLNNVVCHGIPSKETVLKNGDILNIDVTCILDGYFGDTSRMYTVGEISPKAQKLIDDTLHALNLGIQQVKPGNYLGNIGFAISRFARTKGYGVVYEFCGHGIGMVFHENLQVDHAARKNSGPKIRPGMTFTIEPMLNEGRPKVVIDEEDGWTATTIDGKLSAQFEHTILVTETGFEVLTDVMNDYPIS